MTSLRAVVGSCLGVMGGVHAPGGAVSASNAPDGRMATCIARNLTAQPRAASMSGFCWPPSISIIEPLTKWASGEAR